MAKKDTYKYMEEELRGKAGDQHFPYDHANWLELEKMLDDDKKRSPFTWWKWGSLALILMVLLGYGISSSNFGLRASLTQQNSTPINDQLNNNKLETNKSFLSSDSDPLNQISTKISSSNSNEEEIESLQHNEKDLLHDENYLASKNYKKEILFSSTNKNTSTEAILGFIGINEQSGDLNRANNIANIEKMGSLIKLHKIESLPELMQNPILNIPLKTDEFKLLNPSIANIEKIEKSNYKNLSFGINVGLESSKTSLGNRSPLNFNGGIQINYALNKKLALVGGLRYVIDNYRAEKGEYKTLTKLFEQSGDPEYTLARCTMLDFQTGISYHFKNVDGPGLSFQLLAVSNVMLDENYDYKFSDSEKNWTGSWFGAHSTLFSALNISLNYRLPLSSNQFIELSPYAKIPTRGIGHGNIKLNTFGLKLGITLGQ